MRTNKRLLSARITVALFLIVPFVQAAHPDASPENRIKNFGRISQNYYRGAQPKGGDYVYLASLGIRTVIDLERGGDSGEEQAVKQAGMRFYRIPLSDTSEPTKDQIEEFLKIANDSRNLPLYLHCHAGRHRTGALTAIYRITHDQWTPAQAYAEMKQYEFKRGAGHGALKKCVYHYTTSASDTKN
ncbi:MAG TPA: tyrosine-protein phosphatase [Blastocatellia bacterium]|nr:tyrosine-protein phosphatase [Blastocatellia bacterium]